ncbi:DUF202 domain-containing protein [Hydrogenivirga sp.]
MERTFLSSLKFSVYIVGAGITVSKIEFVAKAFGKPELAAFLREVANMLAFVGTFVAGLGIFSFFRTVNHMNKVEPVDKKEVIDPRIYMAAERTFLAWVRTAISITIFGFVIEKFEFFLMQLSKALNWNFHARHESLMSIGMFVIVIGVVTLVLGTANFYRTVYKIDTGYYRTNVWLYKVYGIIIFFTCLILAIDILKII